MYNPESLRNVISEVRYFREPNTSYSSSISPQSSPSYLNWLKTDLEMLLQKIINSSFLHLHLSGLLYTACYTQPSKCSRVPVSRVLGQLCRRAVEGVRLELSPLQLPVHLSSATSWLCHLGQAIESFSASVSSL